MPKVGASMAQVSTANIPVPPDTYLTTLEKPTYKQEGGRESYAIMGKILSGDETGAEHAGRVLFDNISMHKKDGTKNDLGEVQLKRYIEAAFPESKDWDEDRWAEFDTDELAGAQVKCVVKIEPDKQDPEIKRNRITRVLDVN